MLKPCPECGKDVSDKATACPNCGNPLTPTPPKEPEWREEYRDDPKDKEKSSLVHGKNEGCFLQTMNIGCVLVVGFILLVFFLMVVNGNKH